MTASSTRHNRDQAYVEHVARIVATAPPLSADQRERLRSILGTSAKSNGVEPPSPRLPIASHDAAGPLCGVTQ